MRRPLLALAAVPLLALAACGQQIEVGESEGAAVERGAELFNQRCSGCHTLDSASSHGSKSPGSLDEGERTNGPNFNQRKETTDDVLFAIRNGGFSGAIMPANIVVGEEANAVAEFLCRYAGGYDAERDCSIKPIPSQPEAEGSGEGQPGGAQP